MESSKHNAEIGINRSRALFYVTTAIAALTACSVFAQVGPEVIDGGMTEIVNGGGPGTKPNPWNISADLKVGDTGMGTLNILSGGLVSNVNGDIGDDAGSNGTANVIGSGSKWTNTGLFSVGRSGTGALTVSGGGTLATTGVSRIGYWAGSVGSVTINGVGSRWDPLAGVQVGTEGTGTLTISDGGAFASIGQNFNIGLVTGGRGTVDVTGAGSKLDTNSAQFRIGFRGHGTLTIAQGGVVTNVMTVLRRGPSLAPAYIGHQSSGTGLVTVTGAGSKWSVNSSIRVGESGAGTLTIANGGVVDVGAGAGAVSVGNRKDSFLNIGAAAGETPQGAGGLNAATVTLGNGGLGNAKLVFNHTDMSYAFAPVITGAGSVEAYSGTTLLTGANTYTGGTNVHGGTLRVNGSTLGMTNVLSGGVLGGTGSLVDVALASGGTLAPGNSIGTLNVTGDLSFADGAIYEAELNAAGQSDLVAVTGATTISSGAKLSIKGEAGTYPDVTPTYTILTSTGGVTGSFGTITDDLPDVDFTAVYGGNDVRLSYAKIPTPIATSTSEQTTTSPSPLTSPKDVLPASLSSAGAASSMFRTSLGGSRPGSTQSDQRLSFKNLPDSISFSTQSADSRGWTVWGAGLGRKVSVGASGGLPGWDASLGGAIVGVDAAPDIGLPVIATAALGYSNARTTVGTSTSNVGTTHFGIAASLQAGAWTFDAGLSYGKQSYTNTRRIPVGAAVTTATGKTSGSTVGVNLNSYLDLAAMNGSGHSGLSFGPILGLDYSRTHQSGYSETGAGILNLNVASANTVQVAARVGIVGSLTKKIGRANVTFNGLAALERNLADRSSTIVATLPITGQQFTSTSAPIDQNRAVIGLGASMALGANTSANISYEGRMDSRSSDHSATLGISVNF